ncbi:MAG: glycosyltransferase family 4 protein [Phormidesmis sp. RL_2_1]|nr:glycosyltransferase family 4 protein [Phormidesmis sp. RL_2_1]
MRIGFISTVSGYHWAGSEELWYAAALLALSKNDSVNISVSSDMKTSLKLKKISELGAHIYWKNSVIHPRLARITEYFSSSFKPLYARSDVVLLSLGSLLDPIYIPDLLDSLDTSDVPVIVLCQFNAESLQFSPASRAKIQQLFDASAGQIFVSKYNLQLAQRQLAMNFENAHVICNPIRYKQLEPLPWVQKEPVQLACVARFETLWKGQDVLLEVLAQPQWKARDWHLNLYGSGPDEKYVQQLIRYYDLADRVTCRGYVQDIQSVWANNHVMLLPSRGEGAPLAILEAMMCARPTVTTDVGGNREILVEGQTGWIADAAIPSSFGHSLEQAWQHQNHWPEIGKAAHQAALHLAAADPAKQVLECLQHYQSNAVKPV